MQLAVPGGRSDGFDQLRDDLMKKAVRSLIYSLSAQRGVQLWLNEKFTSFIEERGNDARGKLSQFVDELQYCEPDTYFVPSVSFRQGSPNNPYLQPQKRMGHTWEVEPSKLAEGLMQWREMTAEEWHRQLHVLASMQDLDDKTIASLAAMSADMPDAQLLEGLATRIAILEMLNDLRLLPSQTSTCEWLAVFLQDHQSDLKVGGSVSRVLTDLRAEPLRIREGIFFDPMMLADEIHERKGLIAVDMADIVISDTKEGHHAFKSSFLDKCLEL